MLNINGQPLLDFLLSKRSLLRSRPSFWTKYRWLCSRFLWSDVRLLSCFQVLGLVYLPGLLKDWFETSKNLLWFGKIKFVGIGWDCYLLGLIWYFGNSWGSLLEKEERVYRQLFRWLGCFSWREDRRHVSSETWLDCALRFCRTLRFGILLLFQTWILCTRSWFLWKIR